METIILRYLEAEPFQEYTFKMLKIAMELFFDSVKRKKQVDRYLQRLEEDENELEIKNQHKRALIIELVKNVLNYQCFGLNQQMKPVIVQIFVKLKEFNQQQNKGIMTLLNILAQPSEILRTIQQADEKEQKKKEEDIRQLQIKLNGNDEINENMEQSSELFINQQLELYTDKKDRQKNLNYLSPVQQLIQDYSKMNENNESNEGSEDKDSEQIELEFMQKHGIGFKNKQKQEQEYLRKLYHNKSPLSDTKILNQQQNPSQTTPQKVQKKQEASKGRPVRAIEQIESIKARREEESANKMKVEQLKEQRERMIKCKIKEKRERENVVVGVGIESVRKLNYLLLLIVLGMGTVGKGRRDSQNAKIINEEREQETLQLACKKFEKPLKFLFEKYSTASTTSGIARNPYATDLIKESTAITVANIWKLCKDLDLSALISRQEVAKLLQQMFKSDSRKIQSFDFQQFCQILVQIGEIGFNRPPFEKGSVAAGGILEEVLRNIFDFSRTHYLPVNAFEGIFYEEPKEKDAPELLELNERLRDDPKAILPKEYRKVVETHYDFEWTLPESLTQQLPESWTIAHECLNDLVFEILGLQISEPTTVVYQTTRAKPKQFTLYQPLIRREKPLAEPIPKRTSSLNPMSQQQLKPRVFKKPYIPSQMQRDRSQDTSFTSILNPILLSKEEQKEVQRKKELLREQKRIQRQQELHEQMMEMKKRKEQQELERNQTLQQEREEQARRERENRSKLIELQQQKKEEIQRYNSQKQRQKEEQRQRELSVQDQETKRKQRDRVQFLSKEKNKISTNFNKVYEKREQNKQEKVQDTMLQKQKEEEHKQQVQKMLEAEKVRREKELQVQQRIKELLVSPAYKSAFTKNDKPLQYVYNYYSGTADPGAQNKDKQLMFKGFMQFVTQFNLTPGILNHEQMLLVFRSVTKGTNITTKLTYENFQETLFRISIKGLQYFDNIVSFYKQLTAKQKKQNQQAQVNELVQNERMNQGLNQISQNEKEEAQELEHLEEINVDTTLIDEYNYINQVQPGSLEGLFLYLSLPSDKKLLANKLKEMRIENSRNVPPRDKKKEAEALLNQMQSQYNQS